MITIVEKIRPYFSFHVGTKQELLSQLVEDWRIVFTVRTVTYARQDRKSNPTEIKAYMDQTGNAVVFNLQKVRPRFEGPKGKRRKVRCGHWIAYVYVIPFQQFQRFKKIEQGERTFKIEYYAGNVK